MNNIINKELIKKRFEKTLPTYADNAFVQKQMALKLLAELIKKQGKNFEDVLEIGCGCGLLTENILSGLNFNNLYINDIVEKAVNNTKNLSPKIKKIYGDCENITFPTNLDLIISNATFQWIFDFEALSGKIHSSLKKNGIFAFTTFGKSNLSQIKVLTGNSLRYYSQREIEILLNKKFEIIYSNSEIIKMEFDSAIDVLKHLKLSGVNSLEEKQWLKKDLEYFINKCDRNFKSKSGKIELTYNPLYFIAKKT